MFPPDHLKKLQEENYERFEKLKTSHGRFEDRIDHFKENRASAGLKTILPRTLHHFWWLMHNGVAHPLIAVAPVKPFFDFHDYTSDKINGTR